MPVIVTNVSTEQSQLDVIIEKTAFLDFGQKGKGVFNTFNETSDIKFEAAVSGNNVIIYLVVSKYSNRSTPPIFYELM